MGTRERPGGDQGETRDGDQGETRGGDQGETRDGDQGETRGGDQGETRDGDQGETRDGDQGWGPPLFPLSAHIMHTHCVLGVNTVWHIEDSAVFSPQ